MFVLDSSTISYYFRGDATVMLRLQALPPSQIAVPVIVLYELQYGILRMPPELAAPRLAALNQLLQPWQIPPFDAA